MRRFASVVSALWAVAFVAACAAAELPPEVRGTWLTTTANDQIASPAKTAATMRTLREMGLNTVYVETWKNGYTQFPSPTFEKSFGVERRPNLMPGHADYPADAAGLQGPRDLLEETLIAAHRNGLIYIAWFEYGFMAAYKDTHNHIRNEKPEWLTQTKDGELVSDQNPFVWMNPLHPETRDLLMGVVLDAVDRYDLDGVQLDDRIAWPVTMGYDDYTKKIYAQEHDGAMPPDDPRDPEWIAWRAAKVTEFAERFYKELKAKRPHLIVSISPAIYDWSLENYACDWPTWAKRGWMDEFVPQVYRTTWQRYEKDFAFQVESIGDRRGDLISGVRVVGAGPPTPWGDLEKMLRQPRDLGAGGHVLWFSRGVLEVYPQKIKAFYDETGGWVAHPKRGADWRPMPIVAEKIDAGWQVTVDKPGQYRVIVRNGDVWREIESRRFEAGRTTLPIDDADAVELLVDRRGAPDPQARRDERKPIDVTVRIDDVFMRESDIEPMTLDPFLDIAERHDAPVILNVIPNRLTQEPNADGSMAAQLRDALERGHEVTQHGFDHRCPVCEDTGHEFTCVQHDRDMPTELLQRRLANGKAMLERAIGRPVRVYGGVGRDRYTEAMYAALQRLGYTGVTGAPEPRHAQYGLTCIPTGSDYTWALKTEADLEAALRRMKADFNAALKTDAPRAYFQLNFHDHFIRPGWSGGVTLRFLEEALNWIDAHDGAAVRYVASRDLLEHAAQITTTAAPEHRP